MKKIYLSLLLCSGLVSAQSLELVKDIRSGSATSTLSNFAVFQDKMYFSATDGTTGNELWMSDGTNAGTTLIQDYNTGTSSFNPANMKVFNNKLFFAGTTAATGAELYTYSTEDGIKLFADIRTGTTGSSPSKLYVAGDKLYFSASEAVSSVSRIYVTDGSSAPTVLDANFVPSNLIAFGDKIIAAGGPDTSNLEVYIYNGTAFTLLKDIRTNGSSSPSNFYYSPSLNLIFFTARSDENGNEVWITDGTMEGTKLLKDINQSGTDPGISNSNASEFIEYNGKVYFSANNGTNGSEVWVTDGTTAGTVLFKDINVGTGSSKPSLFTSHDNLLYFVANDPAVGRELFVTDGTVKNTKLVGDFYPGTTGSTISDIISYQNNLYVNANINAQVGKELYKLINQTLNITEASKGKIEVFPNPSNGSFRVNHKNNSVYKIYDLNGKLVKNGIVQDSQITTNLKAGNYILSIEQEGKQVSTKIIIN